MLIRQEYFLEYNIMEFDLVDSTMKKVREFDKNTIVVARQQTAGRGKGARVWISNESNNLYFSILLDASKKYDYSQLSFIVSIALRNVIPNSISKWPNDILINDKKCCGILLEFDKDKLIIGCGINIDDYPKNNTNFMATSLKNEGFVIDKWDLLKQFLQSFNFLYEEWQQQGFSVIRAKWMQKCYNLRKEIRVNSEIGVFVDLANDGALIFKNSNGEIKHIRSGDVFKI